jgi:hypothetical protein
VVSNLISLLTTSTTSSTGVSVGTVTVTFPTIATGVAARRLRSASPQAMVFTPPARVGFGREQANPIALAAN